MCVTALEGGHITVDEGYAAQASRRVLSVFHVGASRAAVRTVGSSLCNNSECAAQNPGKPAAVCFVFVATRARVDLDPLDMDGVEVGEEGGCGTSGVFVLVVS